MPKCSFYGKNCLGYFNDQSSNWKPINNMCYIDVRGSKIIWIPRVKT